MAKGQKRSNREVRKPKAVKVPAAGSTALMLNGMLAPTGTLKKKR